jgi:hypothetical protein
VYHKNDGHVSGFRLSSASLPAANKQQTEILAISGYASITDDDVYSHSDDSNTETTINDTPLRKGVTIGERINN